MSDIIIVKNNTAVSVFVEDMGTAVPGSGQRVFSDIFDFTEICVSEDLKYLVNNSIFIINDGTSDLAPLDAIEYLECKSDDLGPSITFPEFSSLMAIAFAHSDDQSSTTSLTYQDKISITVGASLEPGKYLILCSADFQAANNNKQVSARLYNSTDADVYTESYQQTNNNTNWFSFAGQEIVTFDGLSNKTFILQYRSLGGTTCNIKNAHLVFGRLE